MSRAFTIDSLERAITTAIDAEIKEAVEAAVHEAQRRVSERIPEIIASVSLRVHKIFSYEIMREEIMIHVKIEDAQ